jgi:hypothetical protein
MFEQSVPHQFPNPLQLAQRVFRRECLHVHFAKLIDCRMIFRRAEQRELSLAFADRARGNARLAGFVNVVVFERFQNDLRAIQHIPRHPG